MKAWKVSRHGGPECLELIDQPLPKPQTGEALIRIQITALNHLDLWVRKGVSGHTFPLPLIPGCDFGGTIEAFGARSLAQDQALSDAGLKAGTRVLVNPLLSCGRCHACERGLEPTCHHFGLLGETKDGGCAEYACVPVENCVALPNGVSLEDAVCLPISYVTAWSMLNRKAAVRPGETVLIQAAGSGVSVAAIQLAKHLGAQVITTVRSSNKAKQAASLGADHVIVTTEQPLRTALKSLLSPQGKRGVDVVIDHVGSATFPDSLRALDWGGRLVICGATTGSDVQLDLKPLFFKNLSVLGSTMGSRSDLSEVLSLVQQKSIRAVIDQKFAFEDLPKAHAHLEQGLAFGKVLIEQ